MKPYQRIVLLIIVLSVASTTASFFHVVYSYHYHLVNPPEENILLWITTHYGFPFSWFSERRWHLEGQVYIVEFDFNSTAFVWDIILFGVVYSLIGTIGFWAYRRQNRDSH